MSETEQERRDALKVLAKECPGYNEQFGECSFGEHELRDRISLLIGIWEDYVASHPTAVMSSKLFKRAKKISGQMGKLYCKLGAGTPK